MKRFIAVAVAVAALAGCVTSGSVGLNNEIAKASVSVGGPATATPPPDIITKLATAAIPDLQSASADAVAHNDPVANQCWTGLIPVAQEIQAFMAAKNPPAPPGGVPSCVASAPCAFSDFQRLRDEKAAINSLAFFISPAQFNHFRQEINMACGALQMDIQVGIVDPLGLLSGPAASLPVAAPSIGK